ncbi:MAG: rRNA maturation RNase YbeY [Dehalococcoidia bacterium]|nr:rRNA maturation RNase YbeY [Dehalococcoidia bacterium]
MTEHVILVSIAEPFAGALSEERLAATARRALEAEDAPACELSVTVTDDETVRSLNREYAGEDEVTDVLSFSQREGEEFVSPPEGAPQLGEVVIAYPQATRQAQERGHSAEAEVEQLLVHGVLHLLGYDHAEPEEARRMREREEALSHLDS